MNKTRYILAIWGAVCLIMTVAQAAPVDTAFTYQGRLTNSMSAADGPHDFEFRLFDDAAAGAQVGPTLTLEDVPVTAGLFNVTLAFGSVFDGNRRWLGIAVRAGESVEPYTPLTPRQELTATPHALFARRAESADAFALPFNASVSSAATLLSIDNTGTGMAISGVAPTTGVSGSATAATGTTQGGSFRSGSTSGRGVYGWATATAGQTSGVHGQSDSVKGRGVFGEATAITSAANFGGWFQSSGTKGMGAFGWASSPTGATYGLYGMSDADLGRGVQGVATSTTGANYGVYGRSDSAQGRGVYGFAANAMGPTYGGYFENASTTGFGVFGLATGAGDRTYGVYGQSKSTAGEGVHGFAEALTGETRGVVGRSMSTSGRGVMGLAEADSGQTYGGYFESRSKEGAGVYAVADFGRPAVVADYILDVGSPRGDGWLRVYGTKADAPLVSVSAGSHGGNVTVSEGDGPLAAIMEANQDLTGGRLRVYRGGGKGEGVVIQGNTGDNEPMVRITGSSRSAIFDMRPSKPANDAVILPENSIRAPELGDEPGIAVGLDASTSLTESRITLIALDINAPADGYILALATTTAKAEHDGVGTTTAHLGFYDGVTESYTSGALVRGPLPAGTYTVPVATQKIYPVTAGLHTISFIGREDDDDWTAEGSMLTLIYFPTAYGTLPGSAVAAAPRSSIQASASPALAARTESSTLDRANIESELKELKARLTKLEAVLAKAKE